MQGSTSDKKCVRVTPRWEEFLCGFVSGFAQITVTFPLYKTMFLQMLYGVPTRKAISQLKKEGLHTLFRGIGPPLCQKTVSSSIMFGSYDFFGNVIRDLYPNVNAEVSKNLGAAFAGMVEVPYSLPFERVQTLLQNRLFHSKFQNTYQVFKGIYKYHGVAEFYRGLSPVIFRNVVANIIFFSGREKVNASLPSYDGVLKYVQLFVSGGLIGATNSTILYPTNVIKTKMQSKLGGGFESPFEVYRILLKERGRFRSLYRGAHLNFTRSLLSWGITNAVYEIVKESIDDYRQANGDIC